MPVQVTVSPLVMDELKKIIEDSEVGEQSSR